MHFVLELLVYNIDIYCQSIFVGDIVAEVLAVVMSLYMYNEGANLSLPGTDEVLVCDSDTTIEDVRRVHL